MKYFYEYLLGFILFNWVPSISGAPFCELGFLEDRVFFHFLTPIGWLFIFYFTKLLLSPFSSDGLDWPPIYGRHYLWLELSKKTSRDHKLIYGVGNVKPLAQLLLHQIL